MKKLTLLAAFVTWSLLLQPLLGDVDLSQYREFDLDSSAAEIRTQAGTSTEGLKTVHERPALIQELIWRARSGDSVKEIEFNFFNGDLFRMIVHYDRYSTAGLTAQDVIQATSEIYGQALRPIAEITVPTVYGSDEATEVIARWEDEEWSYNLVQLRYEPNFTLAVFSKDFNGPAQLAIVEAIRLDKEEAPQREIDQQKKADLAMEAELKEARSANKPLFRP